MPFTNRSDDLHIEIDTKYFNLTEYEREKMDADLEPLRKVIARFPVRDLYVTMTYNERSTDFHVKTTLLLPGRNLFTGDAENHPVPAFGRCIRKLLNKVEGYKDELDQRPEQAQRVVATNTHDPQRVQAAIDANDYPEFRTALYAYEEPVRKRVGRWVQRYPEVNARIGADLRVDDFVEEVFLTAFERFNDRPADVPLGDWLEQLIDPSIKILLKDPAELEAVSFARTLQNAPPTEERA